jgi:hypothetical protein
MTRTTESLATPTTGRTTVIGVAIGITVGCILTTVVYLAGSPIRVKTGWQSPGAKPTAVEYLLTDTISVALGGAVLAAMLQRSRNAFRRWSMLAGGVAVLAALPLWRLEIPPRL